MSFKLSVILFMIVIPEFTFGQSDKDEIMEAVMEFIAENIDEDQDYSEIYERLNSFRSNPLDINKIGREEFLQLVFVSPLQIGNFLKHRERTGPIQDLLELQGVEGFDLETVRWISSFLTIRPPELLSDLSISKLIQHGEHDLIVRFGKVLQQQQGFIKSDSTEAIYSGSSDRIFTRYRYNQGQKVFLSINMEKDPGETFLRNDGSGFDFYSASIYLRGKRTLKKLVLGDYALQFGQGLTMWSGLGFGKGAALTTVAKQGAGLRPYSSANENSFLRGGSATFGLRNVLFTPFFSYLKLDASLSDSHSEIQSINISGLHRTITERNYKNTVSQIVYGTNLEYVKNSLSIGGTIYRLTLDKPIAASHLLYRKFDFTGSSVSNLGIHYSYTLNNTYLFGEASHSYRSGSAFLTGFLSSLSSKVSASVLYRNYSRDFHSFFNQGLSEGTEAVNERSLYTGLNIKLNRNIEILGYADVFTFPWLKFRVDAPSKGYEFFGLLNYTPNKNFRVSGRVKGQLKDENISGVNAAAGLEEVGKFNYRIEVSCKLSNSFSLRNRLEAVTYKKGNSPGEMGFLNYQDVIYKPLSSKVSGNLRVAIFETGSFNSRIYAYENDVLYAYSVPAYHGKGLRYYLNARYALRKGIDVWLRYATSSYSDQKTIGSGNDEIIGKNKSDVKLQIRLQF